MPNRESPDFWIDVYTIDPFDTKIIDDRLHIEIGRRINGVKMQSMVIFTCHELGLTQKQFKLFSERLGHRFKELTHELHNFIVKRLEAER